MSGSRVCRDRHDVSASNLQESSHVRCSGRHNSSTFLKSRFALTFSGVAR